MTTTAKQDIKIAEFIQGAVEFEVKVASNDFGSLIEFIGDMMEPEEVFSEKQLSSWAESNGYVKE